MQHTLVVLVEDKPGVLNRVASLFRRRVFNIESLSVGHTAEPGISRMTIVIDSDQASAERVTAYLYKLVNVLQVEDLGTVPAVTRDLALVKVAVAGHDRAALLRVVDETRAHIVDTGEQTMTLEITGEPPHVDSVIARLEPLGIIEMVRSGQVAMRRFGGHSEIVEPDLAALPRDEINRVRVISRSPDGLATVNDGCTGCFRQYFVLGADAAIEADATPLGIENQIARFLELRRVDGIKAVAFVFERGANQIADRIDQHERSGLLSSVEKNAPGRLDRLLFSFAQIDAQGAPLVSDGESIARIVGRVAKASVEIFHVGNIFMP